MPVVLIVDDSAIDRRLIAGLAGHGNNWQLDLASDGVQALARMATQLPDIVLTDLQMPGLNGLELVSSVRRKFPQVPVVLMTAQGSEEIAIQALRAGAASYVPKVALTTLLVPTVRRILSQAEEDRSHLELMNHLQSREEHFRIGHELNHVLTMSRYLQQQIGESWGLEKSERLRMGTAFEEALLNALYHGNLELPSSLKDEDFERFYSAAAERKQQQPYQDRMIDIRFSLNPALMAVSIRDQGPGFDPAILPDPRDLEFLDRPHGRGVMLMRSFMDEVRYNSTGNEVTLQKSRFASLRNASPEA